MQFNQVVLPDLVLKSDVYTALRELDLLISSVYKDGEFGFEKVIKTLINSDLHDAVIENLQKNNAGDSQKIRAAVLLEMRNSISKIHVLHLELAVIPTKQLTTTIHKWAEINIGEKVVLDLTYNEVLIAGAKITYEGKYTDESLLKYWPEIWSRVRKKPAN